MGSFFRAKSLRVGQAQIVRSETEGFDLDVKPEIALATWSVVERHQVFDDPGIMQVLAHAKGLFIEAALAGIIV